MSDPKASTSKVASVVGDAIKSGVKETVAAAGGVFGIGALLMKYLFPGSSDANKSDPGLQSAKDGSGQVDEALFYSALADAAEELANGDENRKKLLVGNFLSVFNSQKPTARKNFIIAVGLSESKVNATDPQGAQATAVRNVRGANIMKMILVLDEQSQKSILNAAVSGTDVFKERMQNVEDFLRDLNAKLSSNLPTQCNGRRPSTGPLDLFLSIFRRN